MSKSSSLRENKMGTQPVGSLLVQMALPLMISMLVQALYNIVDSVFVSQMNQAALTAVSNAFPIQSIMISILTGTGVGMNAILSRSLGEQNYENADKAANAGYFLTLCSYLVFVLIGIFVARPFYMSQIRTEEDMIIVEYGVAYMRICCIASLGLCMQMTSERMLQGTGRTFVTMITQSTGAIVNIVLDPLLIFGIGFFPEMGVAGAALATVIGQTTAGLLSVVMNVKKNTDIHIRMQQILHPSLPIIKKIYQVGVPSIIMASIGSVMYYCFNQILVGYTSTASAVFGVYFKLQSFFFMPVFGMNNAIVPIMAFNYGAGKRRRMLQTLKLALVMAMCIMLIGTAAFELIPKVLLGFFSASDELLSIGVPALRIIGIHYPVAAVCIILGTTFQALSKATYSAVVSVGRQLIVLLPLAYLLSRLGGLHMVWWSFPLAEIMSLTLTLYFFRKIYRDIILKVPDED